MSDWVSLIATLTRIADALDKQNEHMQMGSDDSTHQTVLLGEINDRQSEMMELNRKSSETARLHAARCEEVHRRLCEAAGIPYDVEETLN